MLDNIKQRYGGNYMKKIFGRMKILKEAVVLLIAAFLVISTAAVMANTKNIQIAMEKSSHLNFSGIGGMDDVIWDNGQPGTWTIASQLDAGYPFNAQAADDFMFDTETDITGAGWYGRFWNGPPDEINPCDFNIYIYADDGTGNAPTGGGMANPETTALESYTLDDVLGESIGEHTFSYEVTLNPTFTAQPDEKYWIVFQAKFNFPPQWGWLNTDNPVQLSPAVQGFPALEMPFWTPTDHGDQAFYLLGGGGGEPLEVDAGGPYEGNVGEDIQFSGSATGGTPSYTWFWNFGDDNTSEEQNPVHNYSAEGVYTVTLAVTDSGGEIATDNTTATITEQGDEPELEIVEITNILLGMIGVKATVKNVGSAPATDVELNITVEGGFIILNGEASGTVSSLGVNDTAEIKLFPIGFGLGIILDMPTITVTADASEIDPVEDSVEAKIIGPLVLIQ